MRGGCNLIESRILRFDPNGPEESGLQFWDPIDPDGLEAGEPLQRGYIYDEDPASNYLAGVWDCTAMTEKFGPYAVNEFMFLLEGSVTMILENGEEVNVKAGDAFIIPKGLPCQWKQEGTVRKYFVIFEGPDVLVAKDVSSLGIILPKSSLSLGDMDLRTIEDSAGFLGSAPQQHDRVYYRDPSNQMICGLWDSSPFECSKVVSQKNEMLILLEGAMTLFDEEGAEHHFGVGDAAYLPKTTTFGWKSDKHVRAFYCSYDPR
jgi:uncharacterized cupin superfamily protein